MDQSLEFSYIGKWRIETDLIAISEAIQPMNSLQPRIPLPFLVSKGQSIRMIDLKECFFSIFL